jgi:hypothetical protein
LTPWLQNQRVLVNYVQLRKRQEIAMSDSKPEAVQKYFIRTPVKPVEPDYAAIKKRIGIGGGLIFLALILLSSGQGFLVFLGIIAGYFGFKFAKQSISEYFKSRSEYEENRSQYEKDYAIAEPKPSDEQMDQWMDAAINFIKKESLRKLDMEEDDYSVNPLIIGGPAEDLEETKYAFGKDGKVRYSHLNVLIIYLSDHNILTYQCVYSLMQDQTISDTTQEFPYKEISNLQVSNINKEISLVNGKKDSVSGIQQFALYTTGANVIKVAFSFSQSVDQEDGLARIGSENTIKAIRKKLEEYKKKYSR